MVGQHTLGFFLIHVNALADQNFIIPVVSDLQHKSPVHHAVAGLEPSVDDVTVVQVFHPLRTSSAECVTAEAVTEVETNHNLIFLLESDPSRATT